MACEKPDNSRYVSIDIGIVNNYKTIKHVKIEDYHKNEVVYNKNISIPTTEVEVEVEMINVKVWVPDNEVVQPFFMLMIDITYNDDQTKSTFVSEYRFNEGAILNVYCSPTQGSLTTTYK